MISYIGCKPKNGKIYKSIVQKMDRDGFFVCTVWLVWFTRIIAEADTLKMIAKKENH